MKAFNVYLIEAGCKTLYDTVFFDEKNPIVVKKSLINHDGYPANIYVTRSRRSA